MQQLRVACLQQAPSAHANACLRALAESDDTELLVTLPPTLRDAPYDPDQFAWLERGYVLSSLRRDDGLEAELLRFDPDVLLIVSWASPMYRRCARALRGKTIRVLCMDNQWLRTPKQFLGIITSKIFLAPCFDAVFLPGQRQRIFARKLGFSDESIFEGFYSADVNTFSAVPPLGDVGDQRKAFIFAGRLAPEKGVDDLLHAYQLYRAASAEPWDLIVVGTGPLVDLLVGHPGVDHRGFLDPAGLSHEMSRASFLVLPSTFEPWGVVVHEAATAGLGCICSTAVGSADALVVDGVNGRIVGTAAPGELAAALLWAEGRSPEERRALSTKSRSLAAQFSPERWAATVREMARFAP